MASQSEIVLANSTGESHPPKKSKSRTRRKSTPKNTKKAASRTASKPANENKTAKRPAKSKAKSNAMPIMLLRASDIAKDSRPEKPEEINNGTDLKAGVITDNSAVIDVPARSLISAIAEDEI